MKQFNIRIEPDLDQKFRQKVKEKGQTMSHVLRTFIKTFVSEDSWEEFNSSSSTASNKLVLSLAEEIEQLKQKILKLEKKLD